MIRDIFYLVWYACRQFGIEVLLKKEVNVFAACFGLSSFLKCKFMVTCIAKQLLHLTVNSIFMNLIGLFSVKLIFQKTLSFGDAFFHYANLIMLLCFVFGHSYQIVNVIV